jgi:hypothetical protein
MKIKASELRKRLGDVPNADEIVNDLIQKGGVEDDGAGTPVFKSEAFEALTAALLKSVNDLAAVPQEAPARDSGRAERLAKSQAAENAPEVVAAINETGATLEAIEKSLTATQAALAKGLSVLTDANAASLRGFVDLASKVQAIQEKVEELHKAKSAPVEPAGVDAGPGVVAPSPLDAGSAAGAGADEAFFKSFDEADLLIKGRLAKIAAGEAPKSEVPRLQEASIQLISGVRNPDELIAELGLK